MQQRQLRLGDVLDDYCPRERRVTNHAVVAMIGEDVKQTRCTTCDAEHEYKHAKVPRQRRKVTPAPSQLPQAVAGAPKRVGHDVTTEASASDSDLLEPLSAAELDPMLQETDGGDDDGEASGNVEVEEGPVHRPLIRATLPRPEGQPPAMRPAPDFTIRQPGGRQNRFRPRPGGQAFRGRSNGNPNGGSPRSGSPRQGGGRPPLTPSFSKRHGSGRKRSK